MEKSLFGISIHRFSLNRLGRKTRKTSAWLTEGMVYRKKKDVSYIGQMGTRQIFISSPSDYPYPEY